MRIYNINNKDGTQSKLWIMIREPINESALKTIQEMYANFNLVIDSNPLDKNIPDDIDLAMVIFNHARNSIGMVNISPTVVEFPTRIQAEDYFRKVIEVAERDIITNADVQSVEALVMIPHQNDTALINNEISTDENDESSPLNEPGKPYPLSKSERYRISNTGKIMGTVLTAIMISELYSNGRRMLKKEAIERLEMNDPLNSEYGDADVTNKLDIPATKEEVRLTEEKKSSKENKNKIKKLKIRW